MHCRPVDSPLEARSFATGGRKATFAGAGPQPTMFAWFQRSTQVRSVCADDVLCKQDGTNETASRRPEQLRDAPIRKEIPVEASPPSAR